MASEIATAYVRIAPTATGIQGELNKILGSEGTTAGKTAGSNFASSFSSATGRAAAALAPVSAAAQGIFSDAISTAVEFDAQMSKVQAISGAYGQDLESIRELALEMGKTTKFSASESAQGLEYMAMAGWKADQMIAGLPGILNLAAAAGSELGTTSDIVTDSLTAFGYGAEDAGHLADIMAAAATNSNTNVEMMGETFKYAASMAGAMNFSMEDVAIATGLMANSGIKASMAGTSLKNIMQRLAKPTAESQEAMDALGISIDDGQGNMLSFREIMDQMRNSLGDLQYDQEAYTKGVELLNTQLESGAISQEEYDKQLEQLAGSTLKAADAQKAEYAAMLAGSWGLSGLLAVVNTSEEDYNKLCAAVDNSSEAMVKTTEGAVIPLSQALQDGTQYTEEFNGTAEAMASIMQDNLSGRATELKSKMENIKIELGERLMPILEKLTDWISGALDWFSSLDEGTQNLLIGIGGFIAIGTPLLNTISTISSGIGGIVKIGSKLINKTLPGMSSGMGNLSGPASTATTALQNVATAALGIFDAFMIAYDVTELQKAAEGYEAVAQAHTSETETALNTYTELYRTKGKEIADEWATMAYQVDTTGLSMEESQKALAERIEGLWDGVAENMGEGFVKGLEYYFGNGPSGVWQLLCDAGDGIINFFKNTFGIHSPSTVMEDFGINLIAGLDKGISNTAQSELPRILNQTSMDITRSFSGLSISMQTVGSNLMIGLANGIASGQVYAVQAAIAAANAVTTTVQKRLGVHSPSTVFEGIGTNIIAGLDQGLARGEDQIIQRMQRLSGSMANVSAVPAPSTVSMKDASRDITIVLELDRTQFGKAVYKMNNEETQRVGVKLAGGFA